MTNSRSARPSRVAGQAIVEFALMLPVVMMLTVGMIDACRGLWAYTALESVASEGARATIALLFPTSSAPDPCLTGGSSGNTSPLVAQAITAAPVLGLDNTPLSGSAAPLTNNSFSLSAFDRSNNATLCYASAVSVTFKATYTFVPLVSILLGHGSFTMTAQTTLLVE